jgi:hypothetical protein
MKKRSEKDIVEYALTGDDAVYSDVKKQLITRFPNSVVTFAFMNQCNADGLPRTETFDCTVKGWRSVSRNTPRETRFIVVFCNGDKSRVIDVKSTVRSR